MDIFIYQEETRPILTVSQLNREAKELLENNFPAIWVEGEISNFACPSSGHWYFSLKDANASVRCAMFTSRNRIIKFRPEQGMHVLARAKISLYEGRGEFQLIIEHLELAGTGLLQKAFEELKRKLHAEGLFDATYKKPLPNLPKQIGVITSPTGAVVHDILNVLQRRFPSIHIIIYPTAVQGAEAAKQIVNALRIANQRKECEVLILARGGGSLEDLWPFNEETVARAIYASEIPIVSGVGHEVDVTIADYVADRRAPTPSAAAELISPDRFEWQAALAKLNNRLLYLTQQHIQQKILRLDWLTQRLRDPRQKLQEQAQKIKFIEAQLIQSMQHQLTAKQQQFLHLSRTLNTVSPLATLDRGYAIVKSEKTHEIIREATQINVGEKISAHLSVGQLTCVVESINT